MKSKLPILAANLVFGAVLFAGGGGVSGNGIFFGPGTRGGLTVGTEGSHGLWAGGQDGVKGINLAAGGETGVKGIRGGEGTTHVLAAVGAGSGVKGLTGGSSGIVLAMSEGSGVKG